MAVGQYDGLGSVTLPLAEWLNGKSWRTVLPKAPAHPTTAALNGVDCTSSSRCVAVGTTGRSSLVEQWNGSRWQILRSPSRAPLNGISCTRTSFCVAVGGPAPYNYANDFAVAQIWNGKTWQAARVQRPAGETGSSLYGVACVTSSDCNAVGYDYTSQPALATLAEHWNGSAWHIVRSPNAPGRADIFTAISCPAAADCVATGAITPPASKIAPVVARWNGGSWHLVSMPKPIATNTVVNFYGVDCVSVSDCQLAGYLDSPKTGVIPSTGEVSDTSWHVETYLVPASGYSYVLSGLSCTSSISCVAVGKYLPESFIQSTLSLIWMGRFWYTLPSRNL
jgi:hypothetical protein